MLRHGPLVSINVVTRNRREQVLAALASAEAQTYRPLEMVVVDNNSEDGTAEAIEQRWPEAKVIRLHRNIGCQPGRNIGMKNCRGKYIFNLDDDGVLEPRCIERIVERFETEPELAVICAATPPLEAQGEPIDESALGRYRGTFRGGASAIRADGLEKFGFFPEYPRAGSENVLAVRVLDAGMEILYLPQAVMYHPADRKGKVLKEHAYYGGWHVLKTPYQLCPWPDCVFSATWGFIRWFQFYARRWCLLSYLRGVVRFFFDLPDVIATRRPASRYALQKQAFLTYNEVYCVEVSRKFHGYGFFTRLRDRWLAWRRRKRLRKGAAGLSAG
jgi:GT2 family glycosyltransferase